MFQPPRSLLLSVAITVLSTGCSWETVTEWDNAVWSDDAKEVAYLKLTYQSRWGMMHDDTRNDRLQLYRSTIDGFDTKTEMSEQLSGKVTDLYYMRKQSYILMLRSIDDASEEEGLPDTSSAMKAEQFFLDGTRAEVLTLEIPNASLSCKTGSPSTEKNRGLYAVPSPDGTVIALRQRQETCDRGDVEIVTFLDASTLKAMGDSHTVQANTIENFGYHGHGLSGGWLTDGTFVVGVFPNEKPGSGLKFTPGDAPVPVSGIDRWCLRPETKSSNYRADGQSIHITPEGDIVLEEMSPDHIFGCND